jgi:hypothetical protein
VLNVGADRCCVVAGRWYIASATFRVLKVANACSYPMGYGALIHVDGEVIIRSIKEEGGYGCRECRSVSLAV